MKSVSIALSALAIALLGSSRVLGFDGIVPYGRIDAGGAFSMSTGGNFADGTGFGTNYGAAPSIQIGAGFSVAGLALPVRIDSTLAYRSNFSLQPNQTVSIGGTPSNYSGQANVDQWLWLVNGYVDIPTSSGFVPYLGGGIGYANNRLSQMTTTLSLPTITLYDTQTGASTGNFAWALMAGTAYPLGAGLSVDIGYRYVDSGTVKTGGSATSGPLAPVSGKLRTNEVSLGLRFNF